MKVIARRVLVIEEGSLAFVLTFVLAFVLAFVFMAAKATSPKNLLELTRITRIARITIYIINYI